MKSLVLIALIAATLGHTALAADARCADAERNTQYWIFGDNGAYATWRKLCREGNTALDALIGAQASNPGAQAMLRSCGTEETAALAARNLDQVCEQIATGRPAVRTARAAPAVPVAVAAPAAPAPAPPAPPPPAPVAAVAPAPAPPAPPPAPAKPAATKADLLATLQGTWCWKNSSGAEGQNTFSGNAVSVTEIGNLGMADSTLGKLTVLDERQFRLDVSGGVQKLELLDRDTIKWPDGTIGHRCTG